MKTTRKNTTTATVTAESGKRTHTATVTAESGKRTHFDDVLDKVKYVGEGKAPDGSAFIIEDDVVGYNLTALDWLGYAIAKVFVTNRDYLPQHLHDAARRARRVLLGDARNMTVTDYITSGDATIDDLRSAAALSLLASLKANDRKNAVHNALRALDAEISHGRYEARDYKTLPKEEVLCPIDAGLIRALIEGNTSYEVLYEGDADLGIPDETLRYEVSPVMALLFDKVKKSHPFAFADSMCNRWRAFEYFVLNISGKEIAARLAISEQRASALNRETCRWLLDEVKNLGVDALADAANCPKTVVVLRWLQLNAA